MSDSNTTDVCAIGEDEFEDNKHTQPKHPSVADRLRQADPRTWSHKNQLWGAFVAGAVAIVLATKGVATSNVKPNIS